MTRAWVLADRAHRQLGLERQAQLAYHDHIQWGAECLRDLVPNRHPATGERAHYRVGAAQVAQLGREPPALPRTFGPYGCGRPA